MISEYLQGKPPESSIKTFRISLIKKELVSLRWAKMKPRNNSMYVQIKGQWAQGFRKRWNYYSSSLFSNLFGGFQIFLSSSPTKELLNCALINGTEQDLRNVHLKKVPKPGSLTWWCRKILNSLSPMDTPNLQLHLEQFPLKMTWKLAEQLCHIKREKVHIKEGRRGWGTVSPKILSPVWLPIIRRDLINLDLLSEEQRVFIPHQAPQY